MLTFNPKKRFSQIVLSLGLCLLFINRVWAAEYPINQLTNNDYTDRSPQIHNGQVTWMGDVQGYYEFEIFFYDGNNVIRVTNNNATDNEPQIHNGQITWYSWDGHDYEIFFYDGNQTIQLSDNGYTDFNPQIHNGQVVWYGYDGSDYEIFLYNGTQTIQLTDNDYHDYNPQIHNGQVVWYGYDGSDYEIFFYDGSQTTQLTNNEYGDRSPQIHNGQIVWVGWDGSDNEIFLYNGTSAIQLSDNTYWDGDPQIHNGQVAWGTSRAIPYPPYGYLIQRDVFFYDGSQTIQLTEQGSYLHCYPQIDNGMVVWQANPSFGYQNLEIFFYDGSQSIQLTNNATSDSYPQIHSGQVAWSGWDGYDTEIFLATVAVPKVEIVLTFDDGPVGDVTLGTGKNSTESILNDLSTNEIQNDIKAAFFVQTHDSEYGGSSTGESLIIRENNEDHVVAIHTGGEGRHFRWTDHMDRVEQNDPEDIYDANEDGVIDEQDGLNALECDLIAAKKKIEILTGKIPEFVRPPYWTYNSEVVATYQKQDLKMILTDARGRDGGLWFMNISSKVSDNLINAVQVCIEQEMNQIVITLHDTNTKTAKYLNASGIDHPSYLNSIAEGVRRGLELETREEALEHIQFITSVEEIRQILESR